jgi:hypothetical protein
VDIPDVFSSLEFTHTIWKRTTKVSDFKKYPLPVKIEL